jgi:hypothetical protein
MTRIFWNSCPSYLGLNQLVTILMDLPLAAVRANRKKLSMVKRENSRRRNRDMPWARRSRTPAPASTGSFTDGFSKRFYEAATRVKRNENVCLKALASTIP